MTELNHYAYTAPPAIGTVYRAIYARQAQEFMVIAVRPYPAKGTAIITWQGQCRSCRATFTIERGLSGRLDCIRCQACIAKRRAYAYHHPMAKPRLWRKRRT